MKKIRAERIEQILSAAIEVYVEKGIRSTEMGEIVKKACVARWGVYYYIFYIIAAKSFLKEEGPT
jgi:TetR/AcrR family transcriptional regulator